jgi:hypothetical protein
MTCYLLQTTSGEGVLDIATGYWPDDRRVGVRVPAGSRIFTQVVHTGSGAHPVSYPMCIGALSPPTSAEVKKMWSYASTPLIRLHGVLRTNYLLKLSKKSKAILVTGSGGL